MFIPVTRREFELASNLLDIAEAALKRLEHERNVAGEIERWPGEGAMISLIWKDDLSRSISIIVDGPELGDPTYFSVIASAWKDDKDLMWRSSAIADQFERRNGYELDSILNVCHASVTALERKDLKILTRIT